MKWNTKANINKEEEQQEVRRLARLLVLHYFTVWRPEGLSRILPPQEMKVETTEQTWTLISEPRFTSATSAGNEKKNTHTHTGGQNGKTPTRLFFFSSH